MSTINAGYRPIQGSERQPVPGARRVANEDPAATLSVTIRVRRRPDSGMTMPDQVGNAPVMSREEFAARLGASDADLDVVAEYLRAHGLKVEERSNARRVVLASGSVEQMNSAFGVNLGRYEAPTETYRGREGSVHLPAALTPIVEGVFGLDNRRMARRVTTGVRTAFSPFTADTQQHAPALAPKGVLGGPALAVTPLTPPQVASLYNFPVTPDATGQTIGLIEFGGGFIQSDLQQFIGGLGAPVPVPTVVSTHGVTNSPGIDTNEDMEVTLDIDVAASVARNANIALYFAPWTEQGWVDVITTAVHDAVNNPSTLSISWGWPEFQTALGFTWTQQAINAVNATFQDAAALGVTVFIASGDAGSDSNIGDGSAHVLYPGSDPFITSCGGTRIRDVSGSAFTEQTWANSFGTTGGGVSDLFGLPVYQNGVGVPTSVNDGHTGRGIPDIAGNADPASGYNLIVGGVNNGSTGGTSATAPLYAALAALCNARLGRSIGFINPLLYALQDTGVIRDIADGASNATSGAPGYTAGPGWDACTGLGVLDGAAFLGALQARFTKDCTLITDRSSFSKDEVDALLALGNPGVIDATFYVTVDGFTPAELGITTPNPTPAQLAAIAPQMSLAPNVSGMTVSASALRPELPALPAQPQRFTFVYEVSFTDSSGFTAEVLPVQLTASTHGFSSNGLIELVRQPNPYMLDGQVSWLSTDVRVLQLRPGDTLPGSGVVVGGGTASDASQFVKSVITSFNALPATNHPFDLISTDQNTSRLELSEEVNGTPVFNFAIARVRYRALAIDATQVRVFFRLFQASTTGMAFDPATTYRTGGLSGVKIPLLGVNAGEVVTIPCFAELRVDSGTTSMNAQTDPANVQVITHGAGEEHDGYFGCWLDINQTTPQFPISPSGDGPFGAGRMSIQQLVRNQHQCLVAEVAFDPQPIFPGVTPASSDKLSQRNLAIVESDNPGSLASHRIPNVFDIKPTRESLPKGWTPDEIMIDWGNTPIGSEATIYLPGAQADEILEMSAKMYGMTTLQRVDDHTLRCSVGGATWMPVPAAAGANYAALLTVDLPPTVKRGQSFTIVVRQVTSSAHKQAPPPPPPIGARGKAPKPVTPVKNGHGESRHTLGAFQVTIPVSSKARLLQREERNLSVLRWIEESIPRKDRWHPVFQRYVDVIRDRVGAFGGDPSRIRPSPDGSGVLPEPGHEPHPHPRPHEGGERRTSFVGKIETIVYDRFGEFSGFMLDTEDGARQFHCRESELERVLTRAWSGRVRIKVVVEMDDEARPESIMLYAPPPEWHD